MTVLSTLSYGYKVEGIERIFIVRYAHGRRTAGYIERNKTLRVLIGDLMSIPADEMKEISSASFFSWHRRGF